MDTDEAAREAAKTFLKQAARSVDADLTTLARMIGVSPSTLTRFMNQLDAKHIPAFRTLWSVSQRTGVPLPSPTTATADLSQIDRALLVANFAKSLDIDLAEARSLTSASINPTRITEWLDAIHGVPPALENHFLAMLRSASEPSGPPEEQGRPSEGDRRRRR